jgi:hypothetical protein
VGVGIVKVKAEVNNHRHNCDISWIYGILPAI